MPNTQRPQPVNSNTLLALHPTTPASQGVDTPPVRPGRDGTSINLLVPYSMVTAELSVLLDRTDPRLVD